MTMKIECRTCGEKKAPDDFYKITQTRKDGTLYEYHHKHCKGCRVRQAQVRYTENSTEIKNYSAAHRKRPATKARLAQLRADAKEWLRQQKDRPCMDCGTKYPPVAMDFDHRDPTTKKRSLTQMATGHFSIANMEREIAKCDLVCANCHRIRTARRGGWR